MAIVPEREFIRGNHDGPGNRNETYTVCRVNVPKTRFDDECKKGLHPTYLRHEVTGAWRCPAHARRRATHPASVNDYLNKVPNLKQPAQELEVVHLTLDQPAGNNESCVICRLKVPRERLADEIRPGGTSGKTNLHPGYRTITVKGEVYVQGKKSNHQDNVNYTSKCDFCVVS